MKKIGYYILLLAFPLTGFSQEYYLLIGTYTRGKSEGIYVYGFNAASGDITYVSKTTAANPSYLAVSPNEKYVYAVNEDANDKGSISAFSFNKQNGTLQYIDKQSSGGDHPCYVAVHKTGKWVLAANYTGGSFSSLPVMANGTLGVANTIQHTGHGVNTDRQEKPHVHSTVFSPDHKYIFVSDLGIDKVMIYSFNEGNGKSTPAKLPFMATPPGSGPRHFTFAPSGKFAYLTEELSGTVSVYRYQKGTLHFVQRISSLPADYTGTRSGADIHVSPDGRFLYSSNRGQSNTIAIFSINAPNGTLTPVGWQSTLGEVPRNFNIDPTGNFLLVANQESDTIVIFKRDKKTGLLTDTGKRIQVGNPVCLKWMTK